MRSTFLKDRSPAERATVIFLYPLAEATEMVNMAATDIRDFAI